MTYSDSLSMLEKKIDTLVEAFKTVEAATPPDYQPLVRHITTHLRRSATAAFTLNAVMLSDGDQPLTIIT